MDPPTQRLFPPLFPLFFWGVFWRLLRAEAPEALVQHVIICLPHNHLNEPVRDGGRTLVVRLKPRFEHNDSNAESKPIEIGTYRPSMLDHATRYMHAWGGGGGGGGGGVLW